MSMDYVEEIKKNKKSVTLRLEEDTDEIISKIKAKYGGTKSEIVETLIKKYAKEEYGSF
ncbi:TPA: ribbon-helix-helix protein, CopG family [Staphylococcus aureus]